LLAELSRVPHTIRVRATRPFEEIPSYSG